jgi:GT2 family glycosyltransferase
VSAPLVSIVVPSYDRAGFVETTIASLLDQDYDALEVIALDDGSHDETPAVLERIAERVGSDRFRWDRHENIGQAATINRGFELARGELLGYVSSDDYLLPGAIPKLVAAAEEHPDADVIYADFVVIDDADHVTDTVGGLQHTLADALRWSFCIPSVGALMRRRCFERIGGWDSRYRFSPDFEWWLRAGDAKFVRVPEALGAWRSHGGSITANELDAAAVRVRLVERLRIVDEIFARDDLPDDVRAVEHEAYSALLIEFGCLIAGQGELRPDRRFAVEDRITGRASAHARDAVHESIVWHARMLKFTEHRANAASYESGQLRQTVDALRETVQAREEQAVVLTADVERLRGELDAAHHALQVARERAEAHAARPPWLRVARRLTPAPLRPRTGAVVHRLRHLRRP